MNQSAFINHPIVETMYFRLNYNLLPKNASQEFKTYALGIFLSALSKQDIGLESYVIHNRLQNNFNKEEEISEDIILNFSIEKKINKNEVNFYLNCFYQDYLMEITQKDRYETNISMIYSEKEMISSIHVKNWLSLLMMNEKLMATLPKRNEEIMKEKI